MNSAKQYVNQPFQRTSASKPCPICGKTDWCSFNDRIAICMRMESNHPIQGKMNGWLHKLTACPTYYSPSKVPAGVQAKAPIETRDRVYRAFLSLLSLTPEHMKELTENRGFSTEEVKFIDFKSLINVKPWELCRKLIQMGYTLEGVPGFYQAPNKTGNGYYWCFNYFPGYLFPILDATGRIQALQTRLDKPVDGKRKYRLLSSGSKPSGASSGVPVHVARPKKVRDPRIWITEGALKATILSQQIGAVVLGTVSSNTWSTALEVLKQDFPDHMEVVEAYDRDKYTNGHVKRACNELRKALKADGWQVSEALWGKKYKGADDAAIAGSKFYFRKMNRKEDLNDRTNKK